MGVHLGFSEERSGGGEGRPVEVVDSGACETGANPAFESGDLCEVCLRYERFAVGHVEPAAGHQYDDLW